MPFVEGYFTLIDMNASSLALLLVLLVCSGCSKSTTDNVGKMTSRSMEPTIEVGDRIYWVEQSPGEKYKRFDLVMIDSSVGSERLWPRRIIGLGGEKIEIKKGEMITGGISYDWAEVFPSGAGLSVKKTGVFSIPEGHYFCIGDNLNNSRDSREFGPVGVEEIAGRILKVEK